jgi:hypothetical protein
MNDGRQLLRAKRSILKRIRQNWQGWETEFAHRRKTASLAPHESIADRAVLRLAARSQARIKLTGKFWPAVWDLAKAHQSNHA